MFERIEDVFMATNESGRGWNFELVVADRRAGLDADTLERIKGNRRD